MDPIEQNVWFASILGWQSSLWGMATFDAQLVERIKAWQSEHSLTVDGVCGRDTYKARLDADFQALRPQVWGEGSAAARLTLAGEMALNRAKRSWLDDVRDPPTASADYSPSRSAIDNMIRTESGLHWTWEGPYVKDGDFAWCGAFAASVWAPVGLALQLRKKCCASTYRLDRAAQYKPVSDEIAPTPPANATERRAYANLDKSKASLLQFGPRPGDILLVGGKNYGDHIAIVEAFDPAKNVFRTVEGNGYGMSPTSKKVEGVIRREQPLSKVRRMIRWSIHDLVP